LTKELTTEPTHRQMLFDGKVVFEMWGTSAGDMSLARLPEQEYQKTLGDILEKRGIHTLLAPNPAFGSALATAEELTSVTALPFAAQVRRGVKADGAIFSSKGVAFCVTSADCGTGIFYDGETVIATHCGTKCMIDIDARAQGEPSRRIPESIVQSAILSFADKTRKIKAFIGGTLEAMHLEHPFNHPGYGDANRAWVTSAGEEWPDARWRGQSLGLDQGCIDLKGVFRDQAARLGIPKEDIATDNIDTWQDDWWSNRRGNKKERNLVLVYLAK